MATAKQIDFSNVKDGGGFNRNRIPAGDYLAKIIKVEDAPSKKDDIFQYLFTIQVVKRPSSKLPYYCKLQENQLWKLRNILIAAGKTVPKARAKVDPSTIVNKLIGITVEDDDYDDKEQSSISGVFPASELAEGADVPEEEEVAEEAEEAEESLEDLDDIDAPAEAEDDEEEAEEAPEADALAALDRTALKAEIKKLDASFIAKKSQTDDDLRDLLRAAQTVKAAPADTELDELDIDDI